jgi:DNA-binding NarL/FixJ family response regulator
MRRQVILADDHKLLAEGIKTVIEEIEDTVIVLTVHNGAELLSFLDKNTADLVVLDLNMPGVDGLKCLHIIKQLYPAIKVLVLTSYNQPEIIEEVRKLQADGFIVKQSSAAQLKEAVTKVLEGNKYFPLTHASNTVDRSSFFFDDFLKKFQLTKREVDIIRLICKEMSSKQIAAELFLSEFTVTTHRKNIFRKLNVKNVAGLMNFAKENQLV